MRRYLAFYLGFVLLFGGAAPVAISFAIDPYQYFRRAWYEPRFSTNERWQMPGLARVYSYDTIVLGTSMAQNYYPSAVEKALGGRVLKLAMSGSSIHEQALIFEVARRTGQVKRVLWSLDESQCRGAPDRVNESVPFPHFLYTGGPAAWAGYLLNWSVLETSLDILRSKPRPRGARAAGVPDDFDTFDKFYRFARDRLLADYESGKTAPKQPSLDVPAMLLSCEANVVKTIRDNPDIAFDIILPPYSILFWKVEYDRDPEYFHQIMNFSVQLLPRLVSLPNAHVFDFRDDAAVTQDLDRYKDMWHFDERTNRYIVESIAAGRRRLDPADPLAALRRLESQVVTFRLPPSPAQALGN
jgi:hypothetical protein